jgi:hypothetical protein
MGLGRVIHANTARTCIELVTCRATESLIKSLKLQLSLKARANQVIEV